MKKNIIFAAAIAMMAIPAAGQDIVERFGLNFGVSTLGLTAEPTFRINDTFSVRFPTGAASVGFETDAGIEEYTGNLKSTGFGLLGDYHPFDDGFRLTGGIFRTDYRADLQSETRMFGDIPGQIEARVRQRKNVTPALAIGYDGRLGQNGTLSLTAGGIFGDGFKVDGTQVLDLPGGGESIRTPYTDESIRELQEDFGKVKVIPYLQVSAGFRF